MNYVRTILITVALLNIHQPCNAQNEFDTIENVLEPTTNKEEKNEENTDLKKWNDHLNALTNNDTYWDSSNNTPTDPWETDAFDLAKKIITRDKSMAETLRSDFINALNKKTTKFIDISDLVTRFNNFIDVLLAAPETMQETKDLTAPAPTAPIVPEIIPPITTYEPIIESTTTPMATVESSSEGTDTSSTSSQPEQEKNQDQLSQEWSAQLEKIKTEGENWVQIEDILVKTYEAAKNYLKSGNVKENTLQAQLRNALEVRSTKRKLYRLNTQDTMTYFNNEIGIFSPMQQAAFEQPYRFPEPSVPEFIIPDQSQQTDIYDAKLEKLKKELAEKDAKFKEEQKKAAEDRMIALKAAKEALERGTLAEEKVQKLAKAQNEAAAAEEKLKKEYEKKREVDLQEIEKARKSLMYHAEQVAASQKAAAEKGFFSNLTEGVSNWWYGTSSKKPEELSSKEQEKLLAVMVKDVPHYLQEAAKQTFRDFQNTLLNVNKPEFWDEQRSIPTIEWIAKMDALIKDVVITYSLMSDKNAADFVQDILQKSGKISAAALQNIMVKVQTKTKQALAEQESAAHAEQQRKQSQKETREEKIQAQQKAKAEEERIEKEQQRLAQIPHTYREEKKLWYALLDKIAQNKRATPQENHTHTQEAVEKSHSLLRLAGDIPQKSKTALSQKLKQKFSVALLDQQKNSDQSVNVYHNMDIFNTEINKMID